MKHVTSKCRIVAGTALLMLSACASVSQSPESVAKTGFASGSTVQQLVTPGGIPYWHFAMPDADRTAIAFSWASDLPDLPAGQEATGILGIDVMLNGGAGGQNAEEIIASFEDLDAGADLWVQPQELSGFILSPEQHMDKAAEIANVVLTQPNFEQKWFEREKKLLHDDAAENEALVFGQAWNLAREVILGDHPYKRFWSLPLDGVNSITLDGVKAWHANAFTTDGMSITVAGNADINTINATIDRALQGMSDHKAKPIRPFEEPTVPAKTILLHKPDAKKSVILIVGNMPPHSKDKDFAINLGGGVLGHGKQSRLFKAVRSGLRAAYGFSGDTFDMTRQHKLMRISGEVETAKLQQALNEIEKTYDEFVKDGVGVVEFPIAKKFYVRSVLDEIDKPESVAYVMMESKLRSYGADYITTFIENIEGQKRKEVNEIIKQSLPTFESLLKIVVTTDRNAIEGACVITDILDWKSCR